MSRTYQALQKAVKLTAIDPESSTNGMRDAGLDLPEIPARARGDVVQAVEDLLQNKRLVHRFGDQGEWEVRTTLVANRQAWRYRSSVFVRGKEVRKDFPPIDCDRARDIRQAEAMTEDILAGFAREAVEAHFVRCASVAEHTAMAAIFSQPPPGRSRMKTAALVLFSVATLVAAYWLWKGFESVRPEQPYANQPEQSTATPHANQPERITPAPQLPSHWTW
jgi:hypothetical protein